MKNCLLSTDVTVFLFQRKITPQVMSRSYADHTKLLASATKHDTTSSCWSSSCNDVDWCHNIIERVQL